MSSMASKRRKINFSDKTAYPTAALEKIRDRIDRELERRGDDEHAPASVIAPAEANAFEAGLRAELESFMRRRAS